MKILSVVTVVYNGQDSLNETIQSVKNQNERKYIEYIIIDGASTDGTAQIIRNNIDSIDVLISEPDAGIYDAMNKGLNIATGKWILFLNSGDRLYSNSVMENLKNYLCNTTSQIIIGKVAIRDKFGKEKTIGSHTIGSLRTEMAVCHQAIFLSKKIYKKKENKFEGNFNLAADYHQLRKLIAKSVPIEFISLIISEYDTTGISAQNPIPYHQEIIKSIAITETHYLRKWFYIIISFIKHSKIYIRYKFLKSLFQD